MGEVRQQGGLGMQLEGPTAAGLMYCDTGGGPVVVLHGLEALSERRVWHQPEFHTLPPELG